jgi:hypothetical protein
MNSLSDLRDAFVRNGTARIISFIGWQLTTDVGLFELADGQFYRNNQTISKKQLLELTKHGILQ